MAATLESATVKSGKRSRGAGSKANRGWLLVLPTKRACVGSERPCEPHSLWSRVLHKTQGCLVWGRSNTNHRLTVSVAMSISDRTRGKPLSLPCSLKPVSTDSMVGVVNLKEPGIT